MEIEPEYSSSTPWTENFLTYNTRLDRFPLVREVHAHSWAILSVNGALCISSESMRHSSASMKA